MKTGKINLLLSFLFTASFILVNVSVQAQTGIELTGLIVDIEGGDVL